MMMTRSPSTVMLTRWSACRWAARAMAAGKRTPRLLPQCLMSRTIEVKFRLQAMLGRDRDRDRVFPFASGTAGWGEERTPASSAPRSSRFARLIPAFGLTIWLSSLHGWLS
ncbi:exported hypothetical protein [Thiocapsa sp. KS1]|nr:exported hypothetical protein [Thiocapsa sp. KS1]